ncbi:hypothetical protein HWV62_8034 [Athelia sp. TMB]|nr:hypothetical protein HWV62_8034 [Athelia sp. TMB]
MPNHKQQDPTPAGASVVPAAEPAPEPKAPIDVFYCESVLERWVTNDTNLACSFPVEYCEFGPRFTKCKEWLQEEDSDLYDKLYSEEALQQKLGTLGLEGQKKLEKDTAKKEAKAELKAEAAQKKKMASHVTIKRIERNKRKHVTAIHGLEAFDIDLKKAAKQLAQKFATGASVTKNAQGLDEVVVQGDVADEVQELLEDGVGVLKGVPAANVSIVEEKKKGGE